MNISIGDFAFCKNKELGLILWETNCKDPRSGKFYKLYHGINLTPSEKWGKNWQSKSPTKVTKKELKKLMSCSGYMTKKEWERLIK